MASKNLFHSGPPSSLHLVYSVYGMEIIHVSFLKLDFASSASKITDTFLGGGGGGGTEGGVAILSNLLTFRNLLGGWFKNTT